MFFVLKESHTALDSDEFLDKGSQSVDCEPSPLAVRKRGGSYTNLFDSVGNQQPPPSSGAVVPVTTNSSHAKASLPSQNQYAAQSRNTYDPPTRKVMLANVQNGGSLGRYKAPIVKEEEDTKFHSLSSINSPGMKRSSSSSGAGIRSPSVERTLPPRTYSLKPTIRSNSPHNAASLPPHQGDRSNGRPPLSPHSPLPIRSGMKDPSSSFAPSPSLVKDRARNFYPSRSRENLNKPKEQLKSGELLLERKGSADHLSNSHNKLGGSKDNLNSSEDKSSGQYSSSLERTKGNEISVRQSPLNNSLGRDRSKDYTSRSSTGESQPGDAHESKYNNREQYHRDANFPRYDRDTYKSSNLRRGSESQPKDRPVPREAHYPRDRDRSKSFDYDPPRDKPDLKVWDQAVGRNHTLPRKLPESFQKGYGNSVNIYSDGGPHMNHVPQTTPSYHQFNNTSKSGVTILGRLDEVQTVSPSHTQRINAFVNSSNTHQTVHPSSNILMQKGSPSSNASITSSTFTNQSSTLSRKPLPDTVSNVRVLPVNDITEIREKRIGERLWRQNQIPHKEIAKGAYDTYEASV